MIFKPGDKVKYTAKETPYFRDLEGIVLKSNTYETVVRITKNPAGETRREIACYTRNLTLIRKEPLTYERAIKLMEERK